MVELRIKFREGEAPWRRLIVRPVRVKGRRMLQFSHFTATQDITKNLTGSAAGRHLDEALALPFTSLRLMTTTEDIQVTTDRRGRPEVRRNGVVQPREVSLEHDRRKNAPLAAANGDAFLQQVGVLDQQGKVRPSMHDKYVQVNEFLKLLDHGIEKAGLEGPLEVVDLGSGAGMLTFAAYHYLAQVKKIPTKLTGVELRAELVEKCSTRREDLNYADVAFQTVAIEDYHPERPPDIVLALHACDTATDEALAQAVNWQAKLIMAAPCCHHDINRKLAAENQKPLLRHGILKQRAGDLVTDALRAQLLRLSGYDAEVIEFVAPEHTARNLLLRARHTGRATTSKDRREYEAFRDAWGVTPHLEKLLASDTDSAPESSEGP